MIQQGIQQGKREGLLETIELGLSLKFGVEGLKLFPFIAEINEVNQLAAIKETLKISDDLKDIQALISQ